MRDHLDPRSDHSPNSAGLLVPRDAAGMSRRSFGKLLGIGALSAGALATGETVFAQSAHAATVSGPPIGRGEVMLRSWDWINRHIPYSQSAYATEAGGSKTYRQDCSGYASMCWRLDTSYATFTFGDRLATLPNYAALQPGDCLIDRPHHIAIFAGWSDAAHTQPVMHEEYDYGHPAEQRTWANCRSYEAARITNLDIRIPYGVIADKWNALGGASGPLGPSVNDEFDSKRGGRFRDFQNGMIIWHPNVAYAVYGRILAEYRGNGSEGSWGFPTMDEADAAASPKGTKGRYQYFESALILWSEPTDAHLVHGEILNAFESNGREAKLGYPLADEEADGAGRKQRFESATIHWTSSGGAIIGPA
ncbi:LGFP repeat-containing protein [Flexivirga caeni]|uniref:NlpC/P60 domain-containing protein n=1 Tax=Flexivirga caeni TaxID=2294115 RepID=A0A3M9MBA6_9MICO|nr:hypothetical protein [Flexivirga caeni]RNI22860.1 hypothetical protein EFY87_08610 [Flexivirga caeni]